MITEKQKQILKLLTASKDGYNINQIAKLCNLSASWTYETLKNLLNQGVLTAKKQGKSIIFNINHNNNIATKLIELIALESNLNLPEKPKAPKLFEIQNQALNYAIQEVKEAEHGAFYNQSIQKTSGDFNYSPVQSSNGIYNQFPQSGPAYSIAPVGNEGVNSVLNIYAQAGAFGGYNNSFAGGNKHYGSIGAVPAESVGSRVSNNISRFTLSQHTSSHNSTVSGCNYCAPQPKVE